MSINILYPKQFSKEFKDFIIILSNISELKNIKNLPLDNDFLTQNKELEKTLKVERYYESFVKSNNSKSFHNIKIILINDLKINIFVSEGAKFYLKFNKNTNNQLNFIFSTRLISKYSNLCSNFLFGFLNSEQC